MAKFVQSGEMIDHTPSSALSAGDVVELGAVGVGIAVTDIAANKLGALQVDGVVEFPKATGGGTSLSVGDKVYWDADNEEVTTGGSGNTLAGYVVTAAGESAAVVRVKLMKA